MERRRPQHSRNMYKLEERRLWMSHWEAVAARVLATYLIPGCVGRGVRLGSENSSGGAAGGGVWKSGGHFSEKKKGACGNVPTSSGLPEIWGPFFVGKKKRLRQRTHKLRASRNLAPLGFRPKTRFSNGLAYNRSKVSVNKSETGFVIINFSRSIFPYM